MFHAFLLKYAEIGIKGKNRYIFEDKLVSHINRILKPLDGKFTVTKEAGRIYAIAQEEFDFDEVIEHLQKVFGLVAICPLCRVEDKGFEELKQQVVEYVRDTYPDRNFTFKVMSRRINKAYPGTSETINADLGEVLLETFPEMKVDVHSPEHIIHVEIRNIAYIYSKVIPGACGLPVGTNGKGISLLSGGIDSPVATYMIAKRGVEMEAVYFNAPPYTSERAKDKVMELGRIVAQYSGPIKLHIVNFTDCQLAIYKNCPHDELTIIMKRLMFRMAEDIAKRDDCQCIVTGESIGQVSSQTTFSLGVINEAVKDVPVFRPLIGVDKQEIVEMSQKIGTYETSILPYEDCCTIFVAKHPVTKPTLEQIKKSEENLVGIIEELYDKALETAEVVYLK